MSFHLSGIFIFKIMYQFENANQALIGMSMEIVRWGLWRDVRGYRCLEIPHPVMIEISNPTDRYINIPERKWSKYLPFVESLWIALGLNDLDVLPGRYFKNLYDYSDDGRTWRGGYGPRIRAFSGIASDYNVTDPAYRHIMSGFVTVVDQLRYVIESLERDINTRQAIITIGDPAKDDFDEHQTLKVTKDYPCSRVIQFMMVNDRLNCTVYIRSNDILYGMSAVNIFNFTWMQEYVANIIGVPIGKYYHIANNLHVYEKHYEKIVGFASLNLDHYSSNGQYQYEDKIGSLENFDKLITRLYRYEQGVHRGEVYQFVSFGNDMIDDWAKVFLNYKGIVLPFNNPYLNKLFL
jgi:thymidylate synthase